MFEPAAGEQDGEVLDRMATAVAEVAPQEDRRPVEQVGPVFLRLLQLREQFAEGLHRLLFHDLQLGEFARLLAVVRKIVVTERHARDWRWRGCTAQHDRDDPGRVGLEGQVREVEEQPCPAEKVGHNGDVLRWGDGQLRLGRLGPGLVAGQSLLQLADAGEVLVELLAVLGPQRRTQLSALLADVVEHAPTISELAHLVLNFLGAAVEKHFCEHLRR